MLRADQRIASQILSYAGMQTHDQGVGVSARPVDGETDWLGPPQRLTRILDDLPAVIRLD